jgi:YVTN family beta-propeller protein
MHMPERLFQLLFHIGQCFNTFCQTLVKFIESIGKPFSILKRHLRITNYTNTLTTWILVLVAAASLMDGITVYSESNNPSNSTRIVTTVPVGSRPHSIDFGLGKVFITNSGSDSVSVIDAKTDRVIATIPVGANPHGIAAVINDGNNTLDSNLLLKFPYMYVANTDSNTVSVIDAKTNKVVATIPVGANPHRLDLFMSTVYVTNSGSDSVSVIDSKINKVVATIPVDPLPRGIAVDGSGIAYTTNKEASSVSIIDSETNNVLTNIPVGRIPNDVIVASSPYSFYKIYITNSGSNSVSIIAG